MGFDEQLTHEGIGAARLVHDGRAVVVEVALKALQTLLERAVTQVGAAVDHQPRGLAACVRIDDAQVEHAHGRESRARSIIAVTAARRSPESGSRGMNQRYIRRACSRSPLTRAV